MNETNDIWHINNTVCLVAHAFCISIEFQRVAEGEIEENTYNTRTQFDCFLNWSICMIAKFSCHLKPPLWKWHTSGDYVMQCKWNCKGDRDVYGYNVAVQTVLLAQLFAKRHREFVESFQLSTTHARVFVLLQCLLFFLFLLLQTQVGYLSSTYFFHLSA